MSLRVLARLGRSTTTTLLPRHAGDHGREDRSTTTFVHGQGMFLVRGRGNEAYDATGALTGSTVAGKATDLCARLTH